MPAFPVTDAEGGVKIQYVEPECTYPHTEQRPHSIALYEGRMVCGALLDELLTARRLEEPTYGAIGGEL